VLAIGHFVELDKFLKTGLLVGGAGLAALGVMLSLSELYLAHTKWFYGFALAKGVLLVALAKFGGIEKLYWPGIGMLVAGVLMMIIVPGWFLVIVLAGLVCGAYYFYTNNEEVKSRVDDTLNTLRN
jgi:hypothetical protein